MIDNFVYFGRLSNPRAADLRLVRAVRERIGEQPTRQVAEAWVNYERNQ